MALKFGIWDNQSIFNVRYDSLRILSATNMGISTFWDICLATSQYKGWDMLRNN